MDRILRRIARRAGLPFRSQGRSTACAIVLALFTLPAAADRSEALALRDRVPSLEHDAGSGDYAAALQLAKLYFHGIRYLEETPASQLTRSLPMSEWVPGRHRVPTVVAPQPTKLKTLLEGLAARNDAWAMLKLAELHGRPVPAMLDTEDPEDAWGLDTSASRETEQAFPSDSTLSLRFYAQAAEPAAAIIRGPAMAVYATNRAVPAAQQKDFLAQQHLAVALALKSLADRHAQTSGSQDWVAASAEYQRLADLLASPSFTPDSKYAKTNFLPSREDALLQVATMKASGGHGLAADCPAALRQLIAHAKDFPGAGSQRREGERANSYSALQSTIGLLYYNGCPDQAVDRSAAFAWLSRANAGVTPQDRLNNPPPDNKFSLSPPAVVALAELLDHGAPGIAPRPKEAFDTYWVAKSSGVVLLRVAQMIEKGEPYTDLKLERANPYYCLAANEFAEPAALQWLRAHPDVKCTS